MNDSDTPGQVPPPAAPEPTDTPPAEHAAAPAAPPQPPAPAPPQTPAASAPAPAVPAPAAPEPTDTPLAEHAAAPAAAQQAPAPAAPAPPQTAAASAPAPAVPAPAAPAVPPAPTAEATGGAPVLRTAVLAGERAQADEVADKPARPLRDQNNPLTVRDLFEAGVHFGHQTKRWNPKMRQHIYGSRSGIHIVDLDQTVALFKKAFDFVLNTIARGGHVLFVGTKRQAAEIVEEEAKRAGQFFVTNRWLGGTLTNFRTIKTALERLRTLERMAEDGTFEQLPKKEIVRLTKERARLEKHIGGIKGMGSVPQAVFVVDPSQEEIAVAEARKLTIPLVAITDTNCNPDLIDYIIPGNDDAIRSIRLITSAIADAAVYGAAVHRDRQAAGEERADELAPVVSRTGPGPIIYQAPRRG